MPSLEEAPFLEGGNNFELYLSPVSQNTTGLVALGEELFGQRLLSLQLLGLLLLLAFLVALQLLAEGFRRPGVVLQPRLGAATALGGVLIYATFQTPYGGDGYLPAALLLLALAFGALVTQRYAFLQCFLLLEGAGLALNLLFTAASATNESLEGETLVVVAVAVAAAETAVGLGAFLALSQGSTTDGLRAAATQLRYQAPSAFVPQQLSTITCNKPLSPLFLMNHPNHFFPLTQNFSTNNCIGGSSVTAIAKAVSTAKFATFNRSRNLGPLEAILANHGLTYPTPANISYF